MFHCVVVLYSLVCFCECIMCLSLFKSISAWASSSHIPPSTVQLTSTHSTSIFYFFTPLSTSSSCQVSTHLHLSTLVLWQVSAVEEKWGGESQTDGAERNKSDANDCTKNKSQVCIVVQENSFQSSYVLISFFISHCMYSIVDNVSFCIMWSF